MLVHILTAKNIRMLHSSTREVRNHSAVSGCVLTRCLTRSCMPTKTRWARIRSHRWISGRAPRAHRNRSSRRCRRRSPRRASRRKRLPGTRMRASKRAALVCLLCSRLVPSGLWRCCAPGVLSLVPFYLRRFRYHLCGIMHRVEQLVFDASSSSKNSGLLFYLFFLSLPVDAGVNSSNTWVSTFFLFWHACVLYYCRSVQIFGLDLPWGTDGSEFPCLCVWVGESRLVLARQESPHPFPPSFLNLSTTRTHVSLVLSGADHPSLTSFYLGRNPPMPPPLFPLSSYLLLLLPLLPSPLQINAACLEIFPKKRVMRWLYKELNPGCCV